MDRDLTITGLSDIAPRPDLASAARLVGLKDFKSPTLEAVERRRGQLWILSLFVLLASAAVLVLLSMWPTAISSLGMNSGRSTSTVRFLLIGLSVGFVLYTAEKEKHLRRLTRLLVDERVLTGALSHHLSEVTALLDAGKAMNSVLELDAMLDIILSSATSLLLAEGGSIMLLGPDDVLRAVCVRGNEFAIGASVEMGEGIAGQVAHTWEPVLISGQSAGRHNPVDTSMCVPLMHRSRLMGVLNINGSVSRRFTEYDLRAISLFAEQSASAIANARLYEIERLHQAEQAEGESRKSGFLAAVSHDLRTPLTSLIGCTKMLQRSGLSEAHRVELAGMVDRQVVRLSSMVEDLLTTARLESDTPAPPQPVDVAAIVRSASSEFAMQGKQVTVDAPVSAVVEGRPEALRHVLDNLIDNAFKHGAAPVVVRVCEPDAGFIDVVITDHGPGIPVEVRDRVFERFFRLDQNRAIPGIGLGLSIVQGLVVGCGGKVWVDEDPLESGTVMRVRLRAS